MEFWNTERASLREETGNQRAVKTLFPLYCFFRPFRMGNGFFVKGEEADGRREI